MFIFIELWKQKKKFYTWWIKNHKNTISLKYICFFFQSADIFSIYFVVLDIFSILLLLIVKCSNAWIEVHLIAYYLMIYFYKSNMYNLINI